MTNSTLDRKLPMIALLLPLMLILGGCSDDSTDSPATNPDESTAEARGIEHYFPISLGEKRVYMQLAITEAEMQNGLMHRDSLPPDHGMLFLYRRPQQMSFFMRNTRIPLTIGYFDSKGVLRETYNMFPHDETPVRSRSHNIRFALEMNKGWYQDNAISTGTKLDLGALREAIKARGYNPDNYVEPDIFKQ